MEAHGIREYRRHMAAINDRVATTGEEVLITRDGRPWIRIVPATRESILERLHAEGRLTLPSSPREPIEPIDVGGSDSTEVISELRR